MAWPFVKDSMDHAARGQGNLGTSGGGRPMKKALPYDPPKGPIGIRDGGGKRTDVGCCGTQGKH